jgi:hypothetical protein
MTKPPANVLLFFSPCSLTPLLLSTISWRHLFSTSRGQPSPVLAPPFSLLKKIQGSKVTTSLTTHCSSTAHSYRSYHSDALILAFATFVILNRFFFAIYNVFIGIRS